MPATDTHSTSRSESTFPILIVEDNLEHQLVIVHSMSQRFPQARPVFVQTAPQALDYLQASSKREVPSVRLILLDIYLPQPEIGWQLLAAIRLNYPHLPVIAVSAHQLAEDIQGAYDLGVHSFIAKPLTMEQWVNYFDMLRVYWVETVTLPPADQY
ncbi:response regulator [Spirosoma sp. KNUC1025]|uniref:response regulator n=1 Tax=Spirosoma sp. KNUC1025 TaxID=2894082 RepID=UPI00386A084D|nr:response regulator [Spirosoma sp. KNUC1025]